MITNNEQITEQLKKLQGIKGKNRAVELEKTATAIIERYKQLRTIAFPRDDLNFLISDSKISKRQKDRTITAILNLMKEKKQITEYEHVKTICFFRNKPLMSFDYGSFALLMAKNGYNKKEYYKYSYDEAEHIPKKIKVNTLEEADEIINTSYKPREKQGVYSNGSKSVYLQKQKYPTKTYLIL